MSITTDQYKARQTEAEFAKTVRDVARLYGWLVVSFPQMLANPSGFPDLILIKGRRTIFAELKRERDYRFGPKQGEWLNTLDEIGAEVYVWRPSDFPAIEAALRERGEPGEG